MICFYAGFALRLVFGPGIMRSFELVGRYPPLGHRAGNFPWVGAPDGNCADEPFFSETGADLLTFALASIAASPGTPGVAFPSQGAHCPHS